MKIAILDAVPEVYWASDEGRNDGEKFAEMLQAIDTPAELDVLCITRQEWPVSVDDYDAYLLTGSPCSAMDTYDWTPRLSELTQAVIDKRKKLLGVCFGHQFLAQHLGGEVQRNKAGWIIGTHPLRIEQSAPWMSPQQPDTQLYYFNQDHITRLPALATHLGSAPNCPYAAWSLEDRIFCLQAHPEQPLRSMQNFIAASRGEIEDMALDQALATMQDQEPDANLWANWMKNFFVDSDH